MRKLVFISLVFFIVTGLCTTSCNDFFETPDDATMNEDSIFSKIQNTRQLLYQMYMGSMNTVSTHYGSSDHYPRLRHNSPDIISDLGSGFSGSSTDNGPRFHNAQLTSANGIVTGANGPNNWIGEFLFRWTNIRVAHTIIRRIDEVPDTDTAEKERIKAECKFFLAWMNFEMFRRFGGIPLVKDRLDDASEFSIARSSVQDTYDYIIELLDEAIANPHFPARASSQEFGRYTKAFAYGLKAKVMLTAASPLFNTGTPYMNLPEGNDLLCFGSYDKERWKRAADAATEAITYCESNGYAIVSNQATPELNYKVATNDVPSNGNTELIYGWMGKMLREGARYIMPRGQQGWQGTCPTHNLIEMYRKTDGTFINWNSPITTTPDAPYEPFEDLEPRFHATIACNGASWKSYNTSNYTFSPYTLAYYDGSGVANGKEGNAASKQEFSYNLRKYAYDHEGQVEVSPAWWIIHLNMRLAEIYMIRAEALNEYNNGPAGTCVADLNKVLNRSGMSVPEGMSYEQMKTFIERERAIEFCFEDQRYMDLKRTLRAMDVLNFDAVDARCVKTADLRYTYTRTVVQSRKFLSYYYLWPFPQAEINKNYGLIQNPGW